MAYSIQQIQRIIGGHLLNDAPIEGQIERLLFDSRHLVFSTNTLFFAFKSNRQDGHKFIGELYQQGVRHFVITTPLDTALYPTANFMLVENSVVALQTLTRFHRQQFSIPIIGITGSNGKTIVKEWLFQLLYPDFRIVRSPGSYNSQIGVPLSVWQLETQHELGIFEAGISQMGEMARLASVINCNVGIFTNIGAAHSEGFPSQKSKIFEKIKLFERAETIIYNLDNPLVEQTFNAFAKQLRSGQSAPHFFTWSKKTVADLQILRIDKKSSETTLKVIFQEKHFSFSIPFTDDASIENAIHCCATMLLLEISVADIQERMPLLEPVSMRLQLKEGINNCTVINDSYNADLTALELALNFAVKRTGEKSLVLFLSDILQSGLPQKELYQKVAQLILAKKVSVLVAIGTAIRTIRSYLPNNFSVHFFDSTKAYLQQFTMDAFHKQTILLKGARVFEFEKIVRRFSKKVHKTTLEVDLSAIIHNLKVFGRHLRPKTKLIAMVKASAYGSGSVEVAKILEFYKVDYLAVAYADEGVELRKAGIQLPIMVLNPEEASFDALLQYELEPEIYTVDLLQQLVDYWPTNQPVKIHLKIDTGMHRLGFESTQISALLSLLKTHTFLKVATIFSHLAASDMVEHDEFTQQQVQRFSLLYEQICTALSYRPVRHILNSSGILRFSQYQFEMVRLGIGLYGIDGSGFVQSQLKVVNTLKATISQIKTVDSSETVGYNRSGKIHQLKRIATINIGYADGLARKTGNGNYAVSVQGQKASIIGNVCMDMCMIDVSEIPSAKVGDEVIVFGESPTVSDLAECLDTIPYEVFTSVSNRVKRIYFRE
ncbi:MAG: bifunctional UDP-N-acetylmuramoyl-tripeptide:D-alanyl-D-alanine ligase/alanine racemase [Bacteroidota bacterium]